MEINHERIKSYLEYCRYGKNLSPLTLKAYELDLKGFLASAERRTGPGVLPDKEAIRDYIKGLFDQSLKEATIKRKAISLKAFFTYLEDEGILEQNPFRGLRLSIRIPKKVPTVMSMAEISKLIGLPREELEEKKKCALDKIDFLSCTDRKEMRILRDLLVIELLFATGMRVAELSKLDTDDVDIVRGLIKVNGKGSKQRILPIPNSDISTMLSAFIKLRVLQQDGSKFLFKNRLNRRLDTQSIRAIIHGYSAKANLQKRITPHVFRHTIATMLLENGTDIRFVQTFLGHSSILTTQLYTHASEAAQRKAIVLNHPMNSL